jgi:hypothetical protein
VVPGYSGHFELIVVGVACTESSGGRLGLAYWSFAPRGTSSRPLAAAFAVSLASSRSSYLRSNLSAP